MRRTHSTMSISRILMVSYGIVISLFVVSIAVALFAVHQNAAMTDSFYQRPYQVSKGAVALRSTVEEMSTHIEQLIDADSVSDQEQAIAAINRLSDERTKEFDVISAYFAASQDLLDRFADANESLIAYRNDVVAAIEKGDRERAATIFEENYLPQKDITVELASSIVDVAESVARDFVGSAKAVEVVTSVVIGLLGVAAIVIVVLMWRRITQAIAKPIREIDQATRRVATGDLTASIDYDAHNELGSLAASVNDTVASLRMAVRQLDETAEQVARSSSQMSDGSQAVAQGSAEQAIAIEELATNVQNITQVVEENTENVMTANASTSDVLGAVEHSSDQISLTVQTIEDVRQSAQSISQLANSIEDISFQTNILALNASVEAARAGDAGRGFAIVAEEIRRLASQVSEASRAADELAGRAIESVENGGAMIGATSRNMEEAVAATEGIKEMMTAIAQASQQQMEAITQIQESMDSLSEVVQENSAASEESAVIGEELAGHADELKRLIGRFKTEKAADTEIGR